MYGGTQQGALQIPPTPALNEPIFLPGQLQTVAH